MTSFELELRDKIIACLDLEEINPETITSDSFLFAKGEGLELDSIDAIELEVMIKREYGVDILPAERNRSTFGTLRNLSDFILKNRSRDIVDN
jgi:acyl carrier protein